MTFQYELVPLASRSDLSRKCIELLNEEWPRSDGAREHSQSKSTRDSPPMSLLLIESASDSLVGHARVCNLPNRPSGCWLESVIVSKTHRGRGLGKKLMLLTEEYVKQFGFEQAFLSTEDKEEFYRRCGYEQCEPVVHSTAATSVFPVFQSMEISAPRLAAPSSAGTVPSSSPMASSLGVPPPPPPPPAVPTSREISTNTDISTINHVYMSKKI